MSEFPETLMIGQILTRELRKEIERRYNTYVELERQLAEANRKLVVCILAVLGVSA